MDGEADGEVEDGEIEDGVGLGVPVRTAISTTASVLAEGFAALNDEKVSFIFAWLTFRNGSVTVSQQTLIWSVSSQFVILCSNSHALLSSLNLLNRWVHSSLHNQLVNKYDQVTCGLAHLCLRQQKAVAPLEHPI